MADDSWGYPDEPESPTSFHALLLSYKKQRAAGLSQGAVQRQFGFSTREFSILAHAEETIAAYEQREQDVLEVLSSTPAVRAYLYLRNGNRP